VTSRINPVHRMSWLLQFLLWPSITCLMALPAMAANLPPVEQLQQELADGRGKAVFSELQPLEDSFAGQPNYDYLFGQAAVAVQEPLAATWALERLILVEPRHYRGKLLLARAYMDLERYSRAQGLIDEVKDRSSSASVQARAERLNEILQERKQPRRFTLSSRLTAALGHDSNISSSPSASIEQGGETLNFTEESSVFSELKARQKLEYKASEQVTLSGGYRLEDSRPYQESDYIRQRLGVDFSGRYRTDTWEASIKPALSKGWRDGEGEIQETRLGVNGRFQLPAEQSLLAFSSLTNISYDQTPDNDGSFLLLGGGWISKPAGAESPLTLVLTGYYLTSNQPDSASGDMSGPGFNANSLYEYSNNLTLGAQLGWSSRGYSGNRSSENQYSLGLNADYRFDQSWKILPEIRYAMMDSSNELAEYNRLTVKMSVRYEFQPQRF